MNVDTFEDKRRNGNLNCQLLKVLDTFSNRFLHILDQNKAGLEKQAKIQNMSIISDVFQNQNVRHTDI